MDYSAHSQHPHFRIRQLLPPTHAPSVFFPPHLPLSTKTHTSEVPCLPSVADKRHTLSSMPLYFALPTNASRKELAISPVLQRDSLHHHSQN